MTDISPPYQTASTPQIYALTPATADAVICPGEGSNPEPAALRTGLIVSNQLATGNLFLAYGKAATSTVFTVMIPAGQYWEMPPGDVYTGPIHGLWSATGGTATATETY